MNRPLPNVEPIRREPIATEIARRLVDYLLSGGVMPGERMPSERQLAEAFGVGRSAMREALKALTLLGLVEVRHGDGTYLKRDDSAFLPRVIEWGLLLGEQRTLDLVEARQKVEADIAGLAAARRDEADLIDLRRLLAQMEEQATATGDATAFVDVDVAFHLRVAEAARNTALRDILSGVQALLRVWIGRVIAAGDREESYLEHVPILAAIEAGDVAAAEAAMDAHMRSAAGRLERALVEAQARGESPGRGATSGGAVTGTASAPGGPDGNGAGSRSR